MQLAPTTGTGTMENKHEIRPCILVTDKITVERGCTYHRYGLKVKSQKTGAEDATWKTDRHYKNREEAKEADRIYAKVRHRIRTACVPTEIGFICAQANRKDLDDAIQEARDTINQANAKFKHCHIRFKVVLTEILPANEEGAEILRETLERSCDAIRASLQEFDVRKVRDAINGTKGIVEVLADKEARTHLAKARQDARKLATEIHELLKEFDGHVANAMATVTGRAILKRAKASWNF